MVGTAGAGSPVIAAKSGLTSGVVTFAIPAAAIAANIGNTNKTFTLKYDVTRAGVVRSSQVVTVTVTPIPDANLPRPLINGVAHNGTLDIAAMTANASLAITPWPLQVAGKKVWLTFHCGGANPNPYNVWTGYAHPSASGIDHFVLLSWLKSCPNGNQIWVDFKVAYDPNAVEAEAVSFPRTVYNVKASMIPEHTHFDDRLDNGWVATGSTLIAQGFGEGYGGGYSKYISCKVGRSSSLEKVYPVNSFVPGRNYSIRVKLRTPAIISNTVEISVYHENGTRKYRSSYVSTGWGNFTLDFQSLPSGSGSARIAITVWSDTVTARYYIDDIMIF